MIFNQEQLESMAQSVPVWFHSIDFGQGVVTNGLRPLAEMAKALDIICLPDLQGKTVLDINTFDGFFAFEAERRGAARVVALDHYMWAMDLALHHQYWKECKERGVIPTAYHAMPYYEPDKMPGKIGFDTARKALQSRVEGVTGDFMEMNIESLGTFDVVLFLGSLYHMENPLQAMKRVAQVTKGVAVIETEAAVFQGFEQTALCEFFESNELNGDVSNWWAPNEKALAGLCRAAGFQRVDTMASPPIPPDTGSSSSGEILRYRSVVHAWK